MNLAKLLETKPILIKNGSELEISIISNEAFAGEQVIKTKIHELAGEENSFEYIGKGDRKLKLKLYFGSQEEYDSFIDFVSDGSSMLLACSFFPLIPVNVEGGITTESYYKGWGVANISLTTAKNPLQDEDSLYIYGINSLSNKVKDTAGDKKSFLDRLRDYGQNTFDFVSNVNEKVGNITNTVAAYSAAISNMVNGIASGSSIVTNPLNSVRSSASQIVNSLSGALSSMQNAVNAIRKFPDDISQIVDAFSGLGDQLNNLFSSGDKNQDLKNNTSILELVSSSIIAINESISSLSDNPAVIAYDPSTNKQSAFLGAEFFLVEVNRKNNEGLSVLILGSILINLYDNAENINKWNSIDLERLRLQTEKIYFYITNAGLSSDLRLEIDLARVRFFRIFKILYARAIKTVEISVEQPTFLSNVIYSVNGNLDYYDETKELNNIFGSVVEGKILVVSNA